MKFNIILDKEIIEVEFDKKFSDNVEHFEFNSNKGIISETGYRSFFMPIDYKTKNPRKIAKEIAVILQKETAEIMRKINRKRK